MYVGKPTELGLFLQVPNQPWSLKKILFILLHFMPNESMGDYSPV